MPRGGKREGAGRPAQIDGAVNRSIRIARGDAMWIATMARALGLSESEMTRQCIRFARDNWYAKQQKGTKS